MSSREVPADHSYPASKDPFFILKCLLLKIYFFYWKWGVPAPPPPAPPPPRALLYLFSFVFHVLWTKTSEQLVPAKSVHVITRNATALCRCQFVLLWCFVFVVEWINPVQGLPFHRPLNYFGIHSNRAIINETIIFELCFNNTTNKQYPKHGSSHFSSGH